METFTPWNMEELSSRVFPNKIFIYGVYLISIEEIKLHFETFGAVKDVKILQNNKGFAFVEFFDNNAVQKALRNENQFIGNKRIKVKEAYRREDERQNSQNGNSDNDHASIAAGSKIFVGGLPPATTEEELSNYFGSFGTITNRVVIRHPLTKISKGFGFVTYDSSEAAQNVLRTRFHYFNRKFVEVKVAVPEGGMNQLSISYPTNYGHQAYFDGHVSGTNTRIGWSNRYSSYINGLPQTNAHIGWGNHYYGYVYP